ncbi:hypothetical protein KVP09_12640 [Alcaligenaceae bacterium CGII-47]|nr:hypothetical protein [Alcaligenaceae bacterium CGII-47]
MHSILSKVHDAANGNLDVLSTGEALIAALVLNRTDWITDMGYTVTQALERIGPKWSALIPEISRAYGRQKASVNMDSELLREPGEQV